MVFSSIPLYLDPHNWQQQIQNQAGGQHGNNNEITPPQLSLPPQPPSQVAAGSSGSIRPGSMTDRARLAKLPQPEAGLKCPRCESTNTKFCYFNNYNLSQPRHFCKTCRRYWTRGGALRNVPVGGGCRRNKRSKSSSKSPLTTTDRQTGPNNIPTSPSPMSSSSNTDQQIGTNFTQPPPHFPLITSLQGLSQYSSGNLGLSFGGAIGGSQSELGFQVGSSNNNNNGNNSDHHQQQVQNFSNFLAGFDSSNSDLYQFQTEGTEPPSVQPPSSVLGNAQQQLRYLPSSSSSAHQDGQVQQHQLSSQAKSEENQQGGLNLSSRPFTSISENTQYWGGNNSWMNNFSGLNSSSSSHFS